MDPVYTIQPQDTANVRRGDEGHIHGAITVKVSHADGIEPAMRLADKRRGCHGHETIFNKIVNNQGRSLLKMGFNDQDFIGLVAGQVDNPRFKIFKHPVWRKMGDDAAPVARLHHQLRGF